MSKTEQVLELDPPNELKFVGPFEEVALATLKLTNPTNLHVCFKVKTTAPRRYCVRPNSGIVKPNSTVSVSVMLQPFKYDPAEKNKHKFMVQALYAPGDVSSVDFNLDAVFKEADASQLMDSKLRCVFDLPEENPLVTDSPPIPATAKPVEVKETVKSSPAKPTNSDYEVRKAGDEIKRLREEMSSLRHENLQLKETILSARTTSVPHSSYGERKGMPSTILPQTQASLGTPISQYMIAVAIALLGYFVGKFIL